ncbi:MAG: hypothetical protein JXB45_01280 [Candidatus Krumholzibacteriota bacterium]|nr:hypothetical protein [Candidatus Krumholzibacteriota bacterium]
MEKIIPTTGEWRKFYVAASKFRQIECWNWMNVDDLFCVRDPATGELNYCCVLGESGTIFGIAAYPGAEGFHSYLRIQFNEGIEMRDAGIQQKCLFLSFEDREYLTKFDNDLAKKMLYKGKGSHAWPQFRSYIPAYLPDYPDSRQVVLMTHILEQAIDVALRFRDDRSLFPSDGWDSLLARIPVKAGGGLEWRDEIIEPDIMDKSLFDDIHIDELRLAKLKREYKKSRAVWEIEYFLGPGAIVEKGKRGYYPYLLMCVEAETGYVIALWLATPETYQDEFPHRLMDFIEKAGEIPSRILTSREETQDMLNPVAEKLNVPIDFTQELNGIRAAADSMFEYFEEHGSVDSDPREMDLWEDYGSEIRDIMSAGSKDQDPSKDTSKNSDGFPEDVGEIYEQPGGSKIPGEVAGQTPLPVFLGLTPREMGSLINIPFDEQYSPFTLNPVLDGKSIRELKLFNDIVIYLGKLGEIESLPLTKMGNLPRKFCREMKTLGVGGDDPWIEMKKVFNEKDFYGLHLINNLTRLSGLTRKERGKIMLTRRGKNQLKALPASICELYTLVVKTYATRYNWSYEDNYPVAGIIQRSVWFTIRLLQQYGSLERDTAFYGDLFLRAFPSVREEFPMNYYHSTEEYFRDCYTYRVFSRFLHDTGLIKTREIGDKYRKRVRVEKTRLADELVIWKRPLPSPDPIRNSLGD